YSRLPEPRSGNAASAPIEAPVPTDPVDAKEEKLNAPDSGHCKPQFTGAFPVVDEKPLEKPDWRIAAKKLADEIAMEQWKSGVRSFSKRAIAKSIERRWEDKTEYFGTQGRRTESNIRNVGL